MRTFLKALAGTCVALILMGALLDKLSPPSSGITSGKQGYPSQSTPAGGDSHDPRFHGPEHPMYGKNFYQAGNEIVSEMQRAGYSEDQIRLACLAMEATKCQQCNGYGRRGHYRCEVCKGDGVLEN